MSQSLAILRYLGRNYDLYGKTDKELCRQDMVEQQHGDFLLDMGNIVYTTYVCTLHRHFHHDSSSIPH